MIDPKKRQTLKLLGGASLATASVLSVSRITADMATSSSLQHAGSLATNSSSAYGRNELGIQIFNSNGVVENTVVFTNHTNDTIRLLRCLPATIIYNDKFLDLNSVLPQGGLTLKAGQHVAKDIEISALATQTVIEYVWAEHALRTIGDGTALVNLGAFLVDDKAVVFADPEPFMGA